jgi:hypothetical protein
VTVATFCAVVHVHNGDKSHVFAPGDVVPEWAIGKITNPEVWDGAADESAEPKRTVRRAKS